MGVWAGDGAAVGAVVTVGVIAKLGMGAGVGDSAAPGRGVRVGVPSVSEVGVTHARVTSNSDPIKPNRIPLNKAEPPRRRANKSSEKPTKLWESKPELDALVNHPKVTLTLNHP